MHIMVLGIRGIPNVQGGVETHAEQLYERLSHLGCDVEAIVRTPFVPAGQTKVGKIRLRRVWSPSSSGYEALVHSFLGVFLAAFVRPDILHIHAVGPAVVTPLARFLGLRVVVTHHGPDYDRDKWGRFARWVLRTGEKYGVCCSHARIAISRVIVDLIRTRYGREADLIPNGVVPARIRIESDRLLPFNLQSQKYILQVSRLVPEKRQLDLMEAFASLQSRDWKLVLVGGTDESAYCRELQVKAQRCGVVLTGFQTGEVLAQLYSHAGVFVLPSSHEGLPIAMLEALSYGLYVIASDIPANLEVGLDSQNYFPLGDTVALTQRLKSAIDASPTTQVREARQRQVEERYDWRRIAEQTREVYRRVLA